MKTKLSLVLAAVICVGAFTISEAQSAPASFNFDVNGTAGVFGDPGTSLVLATQPVDSTLIGRSCQITIDVHNNDSVRQGTDIVVASSGASLTAENVEAQDQAMRRRRCWATWCWVRRSRARSSSVRKVLLPWRRRSWSIVLTCRRPRPPRRRPRRRSRPRSDRHRSTVAGVVVVSPTFTG